MKSKKELLRHYSNKEPNLFYQIDGYSGPGRRGEDEDGDFFFDADTCELMTTRSCVRILISPQTDKATAVRLLSKIVEQIKTDETFLLSIKEQQAQVKKIELIYNMLKVQGLSHSDFSTLKELASHGCGDDPFDRVPDMPPDEDIPF